MKTPVDLQHLGCALSSGAPDFRSFFDRHTGEIIPVIDEYLRGGDELGASWEDDLRTEGEQILNSPERYVEINPVPSRMTYRWMEQFVDTQPEKVAIKLSKAISGRKPFRSFKDALNYLPDSVTQDWYDHKNRCEKDLAIEWLKENEVEFEER